MDLLRQAQTRLIIGSLLSSSSGLNRHDYGIDHDETIALVAKMTTVCIIVGLATSQSWPMFQMEVKNAFLQGDLKKSTCVYH